MWISNRTYCSYVWFIVLNLIEAPIHSIHNTQIALAVKDQNCCMCLAL